LIISDIEISSKVAEEGRRGRGGIMSEIAIDQINLPGWNDKVLNIEIGLKLDSRPHTIHSSIEI